jgi:hypothetical protein
MGKRRRKRRRRRRKRMTRGGGKEGVEEEEKNYTVEGKKIDNHEKINKEKVGDRRKMEVEEGV